MLSSALSPAVQKIAAQLLGQQNLAPPTQNIFASGQPPARTPEGPAMFTMPGTVAPGGLPQPAESTDLFGPQIDAQQQELTRQRALRDAAYQHLMDNHYPTMKSMKFGTQDLLALLPTVIGLLSGKGGQEFAAGFAPSYLQGKQQNVDQGNQEALNQFGANEKQLEMAAKLAEQSVGDVQGNISTLFTRQNQELNRLSQKDYHDQLLRNKDEDQAAKAKQDASEADRKKETAAAIRRSNARTLGDIQAANAELVKIGSAYALTDDQILQDFQDKQIANPNSPVAKYQKMVQDDLAKFGFIPKSHEGPLARMRTEGISRVAGTDDPDALARIGAMFPEAPTESTLANEKFGFYKGAKRQELQQSWRRVKVAENQLTNAENSLDFREKDAATREFNEGVRSMNSDLEAAAKDSEKQGQEVGKMEADVAAAQAEYDTNKAMDAQAGVKGEGKFTQSARVKLDGARAKLNSIAGGKTRLQLIQEAKALRDQKTAMRQTQPTPPKIDKSGGAGALGSGGTTKGGNKWRPG